MREEAVRNLRFDLLMDQEAGIEQKIKGAQKRLEMLSEMDPLVLKLAPGESVRVGWEEMASRDKRRNHSCRHPS